MHCRDSLYCVSVVDSCMGFILRCYTPSRDQRDRPTAAQLYNFTARTEVSLRIAMWHGVTAVTPTDVRNVRRKRSRPNATQVVFA